MSEDRSTSLLWTVVSPIEAINDDNREAVVRWLSERSSVLIWFSSIVTGSVMLLTLFGHSPGFNNTGSLTLLLSLLLMFFSILSNLVCVWQIPKWKYAVATGLISNGRVMVWNIEITSWLSLVSFLAALVLAVSGNSLP